MFFYAILNRLNFFDSMKCGFLTLTLVEPTDFYLSVSFRIKNDEIQFTSTACLNAFIVISATGWQTLKVTDTTISWAISILRIAGSFSMVNPLMLKLTVTILSHSFQKTLNGLLHGLGNHVPSQFRVSWVIVLAKPQPIKNPLNFIFQKLKKKIMKFSLELNRKATMFWSDEKQMSISHWRRNHFITVQKLHNPN